MRHKRAAAAEARATMKARAAAAREAAARAEAAAAEQARERDVIPWLRALGFSASESRRAAARCAGLPDASLEERLRVALTCFGGRRSPVDRAGAGLETAERRAHGAGASATG